MVVILIALVAAVFMSGAGSSLYPPEAATSQGREIRGLYDIVFAFAVAIFIVVEGLIVWSVVRYRRRPTDVDLPVQTHGNNLVEVIWTVVPTAIVLFLFAISWNTLNTVDAVSAKPDIRIHAIAGQFAWQFEYLDADGNKVASQLVPAYDPATSEGGMAVPVGRSIQVTLDSPDVIHAFYVPKFLFKRDVVPGQTQPLRVHRRRGRGRPRLPRPVRRAVRDGPPDDALQRHRPARRPTTTPGSRRSSPRTTPRPRRSRAAPSST